ncbi:HlyD family secretion protein [Desulfitobacterium sp.]|uniref:HlyD family secretion protein n=1 Tax=Desulfitobacterium sp. TaxID=49981 RepID=UPI002C640D50|nr:efflux RND transporter periplasmic adaptor subunit [Desulfitobacterium sp.]HVJ49281.1 efflux RND transporter periplasmic adaptor subunit [Desulfitobacterium sp.]
MIKTKQWLRQGSIVVLAGTILFTAGCGTPQAVQTTAAPAQGQPVQENVIEAAGKVKAKEIQNLTLDFAATVQAVPVQDGQRVSQGDELMTLDIHDLQQQIVDQENNLKTEQLQLEKAQNAKVTNEAQEASSLQAAQEELSRAKEDLATKQSLFDANALAKTDLVTAQRKVDDAERNVADKSISKETDFRLSIALEQQKISSLETNLQRLKDKLNKSYIQDNKIVADFKNGLVQESTHVAGDPLPAGIKLLSLVNMDSLIVEADVSEDFIKDVKIGAAVEILPLADSSKQYKGKVTKIADQGVEVNGETMIKTEISIDNPDDFLKPDFNVDIKISK